MTTKEILRVAALVVVFIAVGSMAIENYLNRQPKTEQPAPEPFELRTIQVQQGKALITLCIDKRTETAVPCTAFYTLP